MELILRDYLLNLRHTFTISRESHDVQPTLIVELRKNGVSGFGEATSNPYYGVSVKKMTDDLLRLKSKIEELYHLTPEDFWKSMKSELSDNIFALCALDMAFTDLKAKLAGKRLVDLWGYDVSNNPLTNYTIGLDTVEKMVAKMKERPWPIYKIKLGSQDDINIVKELRKHSNAVFRIDANCGWNASQTIQNSKQLKELGVEFIEQPLPANDWKGQLRVYKNSALPIIADESCQIEQDVQKCNGYFHGINVKLTKCGGLTPARRMLENAKSLGLKTMVGCMTESSVGISAIAHLLPLLDYVDMDGALLLSEDIAKGVKIEYGKVSYAEGLGIGAKLKNE